MYDAIRNDPFPRRPKPSNHPWVPLKSFDLFIDCSPIQRRIQLGAVPFDRMTRASTSYLLSHLCPTIFSILHADPARPKAHCCDDKDRNPQGIRITLHSSVLCVIVGEQRGLYRFNVSIAFQSPEQQLLFPLLGSQALGDFKFRQYCRQGP